MFSKMRNVLVVLLVLKFSFASFAGDPTFIADTLSSLGLGVTPQGAPYQSQMDVKKLSLSFFPERDQWREVRGRTRVELPYVLSQPHRPLVFIQSGLANTGTSGYNYFLMAKLSEAGFNVVSVPSQFYWRMALATSTYLRPGETKQDLADIERVYVEVRRSLESKGEIIPGTANHVVGVSYGAYNSIQMQARPFKKIQIQKIVAINPPLDSEFGLRFLDEGLERAQKELTFEQREVVMGGFQTIIFNSDLSFEQKMNQILGSYSDVERQYAISRVFLDGVQETIAVSQLFQDQRVFSQAALTDRLRVARRWTAQRYMNQILVPFYMSLGQSREEIVIGKNVLADIQRSRGQRNLLLVHAMNDSVARPSDIQRAARLLGPQRAIITERGGHVGNLNFPHVVKGILQFLKS